ncbi:MAG: hypothetical protein HUU10_14685, partial [Bacteroidetes bacterium]|nr:hypothetical protein [Bacteroidota bacterium]
MGNTLPANSLEYALFDNVQLIEQAAYAYDANDNMTADANKGMSLEYNLLNLPTKATFSGGTIEWIYTASGAKLAKIITVGTGTPTHMRGFSISLVSIINCLIKTRYNTIVFLDVTENKN